MFVVDEHRVAFDRAWYIGADALRVGEHRAHLGLHYVGRVGEHDDVTERRARLGLTIGADEHRRQRRFWLREDLSVGLVEAACDLPGQFDVRSLVLADGHDVATHHEDVRGLQHRIREQRHRCGLQLQVAYLLLERGDALRPRHADERHEEPEQLQHLRHERLQVDRGLLRVDADGEVVQHALADVRSDLVEIGVARGQDVQVGDQDEGVDLLLQFDAHLERADVVTEV